IFTFRQEDDASITGHLEYNASRFYKKAVQRLVGHLEMLLASAMEQPEQVISTLPMLTAEEQAELRMIGSGARQELTSSLLFHQQVTAQAQQTPDRVAVVCEDQRLTYRELDAWSDHLALRLQRLGVGPDVPVGLCADRSVEMIVGLVAVLKAGGAYVPFDPSFPDERISYMMEDTGLQFVLTQERHLQRPLNAAPNVLLLDDKPDGTFVGHLLKREVTPQHAAYVIYTSGSTGQPKGVVVEHGNLMQYLFAIQQELRLPPGAQYANVSTLAADLGHTAIFPALSSGGTLHVISQDRLMNPDALADYMERHPIDMLKVVPSHLKALLHASEPHKVLPRACIVIGGEVLKWDLVEKVAALSPGLALYNHYGPTETTVGVAVNRIDLQAQDEHHASSVPVGMPLSHVEAYLLDAHQQPVPLGVVGELYIGGPSVSRGYLNRPDVTERSFVTLMIDGEPKRLYRTGDRVRYLSNGQIETLGRFDDQVKIRGYRVELGEIEAALLAHESIEAVCVVKREEEAGDAMLVAYYASADGSAVPAQELEEHLEQRLASYMIPDAFVCLEAMPLTGNGKIDRGRLPAPALDATPQPNAFVSPRDRYELEMTSIWEEVLQGSQVGVTDNFFEIGGHSLKVLSMMTKIRQRFGILVPINSFLSNPTIAALCNFIRGEASGANQHCLVEIQKGTGDDAPWLFTHPGGGSVFAYYHLARCLGSDATVYGFQSAGLESDEMPLDTVEAMARRYLAEIKQAGVSGPYRLLGWSFGGYVAYEMARILEAEGEGVAEIALLDVHAPDVGDGARSPVVRTLDAMASEAGLEESQWRDLPDAEAIELIYTALRDRGLLMEWETERTFASQMSVRIGNATARDRFRQSALRTAPPIRSDLHVFCVQERDPMQPQRPLVDAAKWGPYTYGDVLVHPIPGHHNSLVELPHAQAVAEILSLSLAL
ncbi:MAG: amino acid adenylation domain-containing protein, partial [Tumebacillaceae bacterium]